jgi:hypothetical protein
MSIGRGDGAAVADECTLIRKTTDDGARIARQDSPRVGTPTVT